MAQRYEVARQASMNGDDKFLTSQIIYGTLSILLKRKKVSQYRKEHSCTKEKPQKNFKKFKPRMDLLTTE